MEPTRTYGSEQPKRHMHDPRLALHTKAEPAFLEPDCPIHASSFQSTISVPFPVPPPATATPGIGTMPRPATARPVTQLGEAAVANASDGQSGKFLLRSTAIQPPVLAG